jgi:YYY domain-containing protein
VSIADSLIYAVQWYLVVSIAGILVYPLVYLSCQYLPDRGLSLYRPVGIAVIAFPLWWAGNVVAVPFSTASVVAVALAVGILAWVSAHKRRDIFAFLRVRCKRIIVLESATLLLFSLYIVFRGFNPHVRGTEKPMESAFLNTGIRGDSLPLKDPWLSGEIVNYYDFGYVVFSAIAKLASVPGEIAFNLSLATLFALATVGAAGLAANLSHLVAGSRAAGEIVAGAIAGFFVAFAGNLHTARELLSDPETTLNASWWSGPGWRASRIVEDSGFSDGGVRTVITEFPAFSWVLGDLHPHVIAYPWLVVGLALSVNLGFAFMGPSPQRGYSAVLIGVPVGIASGVLLGSNTWDVPIVIAIVAAMFVIAMRSQPIRTLLLTGIGVVISFLVVSLPFLLRYDSPTGDQRNAMPEVDGISVLVNSIGYVAWDRSSVDELLTHWGALFVLLMAIVGFFWISVQKLRTKDFVALLTGSALLVLTGFVLQAVALPLFGIPALAIILIILRRQSMSALQVTFALCVIAFVALITTEFFFVRDPFGDRMNTVFKVWLQAWLVLSIAGAALLPSAIERASHRWGTTGRAISVGFIGVVLVSTMLYTPLSVYRWTDQFQQWHGIDGIHYLEAVHPDERRAIESLQAGSRSVNVLLEAPGCAYGSDNGIPHSRVSAMTGIPTVIGWEGHQYQWRRGQRETLSTISERIDHVRAMYETPHATPDLFDQYEVSHVYVGVHERLGYRECEIGGPYDIPDPPILEDLGWEPVFETETVTIYQVDSQGSEN